DGHAAVRALGGAALTDSGHPGVADLAAPGAVDAAHVEDEVVEVAVVAAAGERHGVAPRVAAMPAGRAGRLVLESDVVAVRIGGRLIDERRDPGGAVGGRARG